MPAEPPVIGSTDPFATPPGERDPVRRLRARLAAGVTLWTAGPPTAPVGLTVSSLLVAPGEPPLVFGLVAELTDLYEAIEEHGVFTVHVLTAGDRALADVFAGMRPAPGGPFRGLRVGPSPWGPVLANSRARAGCRLVGSRPAGFARLVEAAIEDVSFEDGPAGTALAHYRGRYVPLPPASRPSAGGLAAD